jgi:tripartite-type tricarboxylate transporter receptor subunit TctC
MKFRLGLRVRLACVLVLIASSASMAQNYPAHAIRVIIPLSAGSLTDVIVRKVVPSISSTLGAPLVIDNRPGAGAIVGTTSIAQAAPDGYTLGVAVASSFSVNPSMRKDLPYDPVKDFAPVCRIGGGPYVLAANALLGIKSIPELVATAKANTLSFASAGAGTPSHLVQEMFKARLQLSFLHVPYRGTAQAVTDTIGGHSQLLFDTPGPLLSGIRSGQLIALGITTPRRLSSLPEVPTFEELGFPGFLLVGWVGLVVPTGTPAPIVSRLAQACQTAVALPDVQTLAQDQGFLMDYAPPAEFGAYIANELLRWGELVRLAGVKAD